MRCVLIPRKQRCSSREWQNIIFPSPIHCTHHSPQAEEDIMSQAGEWTAGRSSLNRADIFTFDFCFTGSLPNLHWKKKKPLLACKILCGVCVCVSLFISYPHEESVVVFSNPLACPHLLFVLQYRPMPMLPRTVSEFFLLVNGFSLFFL